MTLREFIADHYEHYAATHHRSLKNLNCLRSVFAGLLDGSLSDITPWTIEVHRRDRKAAGIRPTTINREVVVIKAAKHGLAAQFGVLDHNPLAGLKPLKTDLTGGVTRYLSAEEEGRLLAALAELKTDDRMRPMVLVSLHTGLRAGELKALKWQDIHLGERRLVVRGEGAKSRQTRFIPLNGSAHAALTDWLIVRRTALELPADTPLTGVVFPGGRRDGRIDNVRRSWATLLKTAGIKDFRWHDLRHHFASRLVQSGADLNVVRSYSGTKASR